MSNVKQMFLFLLTRTSVLDIVNLKEGDNMKRVLVNYGGAIIFYFVIIAMVFIVNARFDYLNNVNNKVTYAYNN